MTDYHTAWLERTGADPEFLLDALRNGFHIHHLDGDHDNNDGANLILIYGKDHGLLHGATVFAGHVGGRWKTKEELDLHKITNGKVAYDQRAAGAPWAEIKVPNALGLAKHYALHNNLEWPIPISPAGWLKSRSIGADAYNRRQQGESWVAIGRSHGLYGGDVAAKAKSYAKINSMSWPI